MNKICKEWTVQMPWGNVAMISWGYEDLPPVLLVHGYVDSAATFIPLLDLLPDKYYYVGFDMPGHGKSDPSPGTMVSHIDMVEVVKRVVDHLKWHRFMYLGHSMAYIIGSYYNMVCPGRISRMVNLDPWPAVGVHIFYSDEEFWFKFLYNSYYGKYDTYGIIQDPKEFTYEEAVGTMMLGRNVDEREAKILLTRCLVPSSGGKYRFSWQPKVKKMTTLHIPIEDLASIFKFQPPPTLNVNASVVKSGEPAISIFKNLQEELEIVYGHQNVTAEGGHDVHLTNPSDFANKVAEFLVKEVLVSAKL